MITLSGEFLFADVLDSETAYWCMGVYVTCLTLVLGKMFMTDYKIFQDYPPMAALVAPFMPPPLLMIIGYIGWGLAPFLGEITAFVFICAFCLLLLGFLFVEYVMPHCCREKFFGY